MSRSTLAEIQTKVSPWKRDITDAEIEALCNLVLMELDESFGRHVRRTITTKAPDTTPTIDINQESTSATVASGSFPTTYDGQYIQIEGSDAWYEISDTVANTSFAISSGFEGEDITGGTCEVAFPRVVMPSDLLVVDRVYRPGKEPLRFMASEVPIGGASNLQTSEPVAYYEADILNSDDDLEIMLVDPPNAVYTYIVEGRARISRFSGTSSKCGLPERFENVLLLGTIWAAISQSEGEDAASFWYAWFNRALKKARAGKGPSYVGGSKSMKPKTTISFRHPDLVTDD